jgi:hypothetical protein
VATIDIALVEEKVLFLEQGFVPEHAEVLIQAPGAALAAAGAEVRDRDTHGNAGLALATLGAIDMLPATPEPPLGKAAVELGILWIVGIYEDRGGLLMG